MKAANGGRDGAGSGVEAADRIGLFARAAKMGQNARRPESIIKYGFHYHAVAFNAVVNLKGKVREADAVVAVIH